MGVPNDVIDFFRAFDEVERRRRVVPRAWPRASREKAVYKVSGTESDGAAAVASLSKRYIRERAKLKALDLPGEKAADDDNALAGDSVESASSTASLDKKAPKDDVKTDRYKWQSK